MRENITKAVICTSLLSFVAGCGTAPTAYSDSSTKSSSSPTQNVIADGWRNSSPKSEFSTNVLAKKFSITNISSDARKSFELAPLSGYHRQQINIDGLFVSRFNELVETTQSGPLPEVKLTIVDSELHHTVAGSDLIPFIGLFAMATAPRTFSCTVSLNITSEVESTKHKLVAFVPKFATETKDLNPDVIKYLKGRSLNGLGDCIAVLVEQTVDLINKDAKRLGSIK